MNTSVWVSGVGMISAIGNNSAECLQSLEAGRSGIGLINELDTVHHSEFPVGEVKKSNKELANLTNLSPNISRTVLLSFLAAKEALNDAAIENFSSLRTGFISANSVGGMDKSEQFFSEFFTNYRKGSLRNVINHECGRISEIVADQLGITHFISTISTACSSSANSIFFATRMIKNNLLDVVIAGGVDALTKFTLNGFNTLMILDNELCKPFDENRKGLNLGEGAGYVVLVSEKVAKSLKKNPYCRLSGYCNANDAYHQTASSPEGMGSFLAMQGALQKSGLQPVEIDYINLHGTGTQNNDISEGAAIQRLFCAPFPKMSSTKSFTGHTLGASGGIEAVLSVLSVKLGIIYPNLHFKTSMKEFAFVPETRFLKNLSLNHVLSNSFGFGGNCTSLIFSKS